MRTLVVSDLHLGSVTGADVLRRAELRVPLLAAARDVDRLVLLGDVLELRHGPPREALAAARPFFEELGSALAPGELIVVAGNHDYPLVEPWLARRAERPAPGRLGLEQLLEPQEASPMLARIADWAAPARVRGAYPGVWLREDVYAMHGHYLDCHLTVPTLERLSVGVMCRTLGHPVSGLASVEDYEAVTGPLYAWRCAVARDARTSEALNGIATARAWGALGGRGEGGHPNPDGSIPPSSQRPSLRRRLRRRALVRAFPLAVAALNRAGLGPLSAEISGRELRRAGLRAMGEVVGRLGITGGYVVFGHTHRAGPFPADHPQEWRAPPGDAGPVRLLNVGSWAYASMFLTPTPGESPYWPGSCVLVEDSGPPAVRGLLLDCTLEQLRPVPA